jgi:hypothetical protein
MPKTRSLRAWRFLALFLIASVFLFVLADAIISQIANMGSTSVCTGNNWLELHDTGPDNQPLRLRVT